MTIVPGGNVLRSQGLQFVRMIQGALRLSSMYSATHAQVQTLVQNALSVLQSVLKETETLSVSFQFNSVVLNSMPIQDASLSSLAVEMAKREIGYLRFSRGIDTAGLTAFIAVLTLSPDAVKKAGGVGGYLREHPIKHVSLLPVSQTGAEEALGAAAGAGDESAGYAKAPRWLLTLLDQYRAESNVTVDTSELQQLGTALAPALSTEQKELLPQLQELVAYALRVGNPAAILETARAAGGGGPDPLVQTVLLKAFQVAAANNDRLHCERLLRAAAGSGLSMADLVQAIPPAAPPELRQAVEGYGTWVTRPVAERLASVTQKSNLLECEWLLGDAEEAARQLQWSTVHEAVTAIFRARPAGEPQQVAGILDRAQVLLAEICASGLPPNAAELVEMMVPRLREPECVVPLLSALSTLCQTAVEAQNIALATAAANAVSQLAASDSPLAPIAHQAQSTLLKPDTLSRLVTVMVNKQGDPAVLQSIQGLLKRVAPPVAHELMARLETEPLSARRLRMLQLLKLLGKSAIPALVEKLSHPEWFVVRNAVTALGEIGDASMLPDLGPALNHPDQRVQQAAILAAQRTRSDRRAEPLARALLRLKPAVLTGVLEDLFVLKQPATTPFIEEFILAQRPDVRFDQIEKGLFALGAMESNDAVQALLNCAKAAALALPYRQTALKVLGRMNTAASQDALKYFIKTEKERTLIEQASEFVSVWDYRSL